MKIYQGFFLFFELLDKLVFGQRNKGIQVLFGPSQRIAIELQRKVKQLQHK